MALAIISTGLVHLHVHWPPGLWWGAVGGLAYAVAQFLIEGFPEGQSRRLYLAQVAARIILGAIVGAATLAFHDSAAFVAGLAGPAALVALGARFGRRKPPPGGKDAANHADGQQDTRPGT